ncbi:MAG: 5'-nucleotidase C-terminal domain-containing protein, partial [Candidatus Gastranaerophilales bacterium]|nr:5'-nucleotidase C-terminal domain-containing protein [Candidatus Gastranaerophilales bacterium]
TVRSNRDEMFPNSNKKNTLNVFDVAGDFFINPTKTGLRTPQAENTGRTYVLFLNIFTDSIRKLLDRNSNSEIIGRNSNFEAIYTPGNHCFDGGDGWLLDTMKRMRMTTVLTNADFKKSPLIKKHKNESRNAEMKERIKQYKILEVADDKNPNLKNKILVLGVTIPGVDYYTPGLVQDLHIIDRCNKKDVKIEEKDLKNTFKILDKTIKKFKDEYPDGAVVLNSHTGMRLSKMIAEKVPDINVILNGHDHVDVEEKVNNTHIVSLSSDNKLVAAIKLHFDDDGKLDNLDGEKIAKKFYSKDTKPQKNNHIQKFLKNLFEEDQKPLIKINDPNGEVSKLEVVEEEIRTENSLLANYVTDSVLSSIKKNNPDVQAFGLLSSAFRDGSTLKEDSTNMDLINLMDGSIVALSEVYIGEVSGKNLAGLITENVVDNLKSSRNTILQWSGIKIDKNAFKKASESDNFDDINQSILIKKDGKYEPIDYSDTYKIALPLKYLIKDSIKYPPKIKKSFEKTNKSVDDYFIKHLEKNNFVINIDDNVREKRIITQ